jgi:hypothetical protein
MSAKTSKFMILFGIFLIVSAMVFVPLGVGPDKDPTALASGASLFSLGALSIGTGFYVKGRALEERFRQEAARAASAPPSKKKKIACEVCRELPPVISCSQHRALLCAECMTAHYDARTCVYVPAQRRSARPAAAAANG